MKFKDIGSKDLFEGMMGGISRCAPAQDVKYDKVLDTVIDKWKGDKVAVTEISKGKEEQWVKGANKWRDEQTAAGGGSNPKIVAKADQRAERTMKIKNKHAKEPINELSVDTLKRYSKGVEQINPATTPKYKMVKHGEGHTKAGHRIAHMTGDRNSKMYEAKLEEIMEAMGFAGILNKQEKEKAPAPKAKPVTIPFGDKGRWAIRYRPASRAGEKVLWQVLDLRHEDNPDKVIAFSGQATTNKDAVRDAEEWIGNRGNIQNGSEIKSSTTLDFNAAFAREIAPERETFYATVSTFEGKPALYMSFKPCPEFGLKKSSPRGANTNLPGVPLNAKSANEAKLMSHGRYELMGRQVYDEEQGIYVFPLRFDSVADSKTDTKPLPFPAFTVGTSDRTN